MESKNRNKSEVIYINEEDVKNILTNCGHSNKDTVIEDFIVHHASDKMMGFLADYLKLKLVITENKARKSLHFFVKLVSRTNAAKASMVLETNLFQKESYFYSIPLDIAGVKQWRPKFIAALNDALVFQDLSTIHYKMRNKFQKFDMAHTLQALNALANMHASSIIFEEKRKIELQRPYYVITDDNEILLHMGGYTADDPWFVQCKKAALDAIKSFSKYSNDTHTVSMIESRWDDVFENALLFGKSSSRYRNVVSHRDLWNNNILFHYKKNGDNLDPDDCVFVDYQAVSYQPPAGDIMLLLYCNLETKFREENLNMFLNYYHSELRSILCNFGISINDVLTKEDFLSSVEEYRVWGVVASTCLIQLFWLDDDVTTSTFSDSAQFLDILTKNKSKFVRKMMQSNEDYKINILSKVEELVERYCI